MSLITTFSSDDENISGLASFPESRVKVFFNSNLKVIVSIDLFNLHLFFLGLLSFFGEIISFLQEYRIQNRMDIFLVCYEYI